MTEREWVKEKLFLRQDSVGERGACVNVLVCACVLVCVTVSGVLCVWYLQREMVSRTVLV